MLRYLLPTIIVLVLLTAMGHVAVADASGESNSSEVRTTRATPSSASLLAAICPVEEALDRRRSTCDLCPDQAPRDRGRLMARRIYRGDFTGDGQTRAVVALNGCGADDASGHATAFLEQTARGWDETDYRQGLNTSSCRTAQLDESTALICENRRVEGDTSRTDVYALHHGDDGWLKTELDEMFDLSADCDNDGQVIRRLDSIHTGELLADGSEAVGLAVESRHRNQEAGCNELETSLQLKVFEPTDDGFAPVDIDEPCAQPGRAKALETASPGHCSR